MKNPTPTPPAARRHPRPALLALVLALSAAPAAAQGPPAPVRVASLRSEVIVERRKVTGDLRSTRRSLIAAEEAGLVLELAVREGDRLAAGDLLCRLDATRIELELAELAAQVAMGRAEIVEREADLERARRDRDALASLLERRATNQKELDDAGSALAVAQARRDQAVRSVEVAQARAALVERRVRDCEIRAPFAGQVTARHTQVGQWLDRGDAVCELVATDDVEVWLAVPQRLYAALAAEGPEASSIEVQVDATGETFELRDHRTMAWVDAAARSFWTIAPLASVADEGGRRRAVAPGMSVTAWVQSGERAQRLLAPRDAILRNEVGPYLYAVTPGQEGAPAVAMLVPVQALFSVGESVVIESPRLGPGTQVVVEGNERLYPMAPIVPMPAGAAGGGSEGAGEATR